MDLRGEITRRSVKKLRKYRLVKDRVGERNLELGCAAAGLSRMLARGFWVGMDFDLSTVRDYSRYLGRPAAVGSENLPFRHGSFTTVLMLDFLEHVEEDLLLLKEARRVLVPGGSLLLSVPRGGNLLIIKIRNLLGLKKEVYGHRREGYTREELLSMLEEAGFAVEEVKEHSGFLLELLEALQNFVYFRLRGRKKRRAGSISPVEEGEFRSMKKLLFLQKLAYPFFKLADFLDGVLPTSKHVIFVQARSPKRTPG